ncbi:MAG: class I tRNA ligase family protein [Kofleriaceae bacterium]
MYDDLCDWFVELAKPNLHQSPELVQDPAKATHRHVVQGVLAHCLEQTMRLLHPFAPFVTEEIWQKLPKSAVSSESLMISIFPSADPSWANPEAEGQIKVLQDVVAACRKLRQTYNVPPTQKVAVEIRVDDANQRKTLETFAAFIQKIAKLDMKLAPAGGAIPSGSAREIISSTMDVVMPLGGLIDPVAEKTRLAKEIEKANKEIGQIEKKLGNADFVAKAPEDVVTEQKARLTEQKQMVEQLQAALQTLAGA